MNTLGKGLALIAAAATVGACAPASAAGSPDGTLTAYYAALHARDFAGACQIVEDRSTFVTPCTDKLAHRYSNRDLDRMVDVVVSLDGVNTGANPVIIPAVNVTGAGERIDYTPTIVERTPDGWKVIFTRG